MDPNWLEMDQNDMKIAFSLAILSVSDRQSEPFLGWERYPQPASIRALIVAKNRELRARISRASRQSS